MILRMSWLRDVNSVIDWKTRSWQKRSAQCATSNDAVEKTELLNFSVKEDISSVSLHSSCSAIACVNAAVFQRFCKRNSSQAYAIQTYASKSLASQLLSCDLSVKNQIQISSQYSDFKEVFSKVIDSMLLKHVSHDLSIDIEDWDSFFDSLYNLSANELTILRAYIDKHLLIEFIVSFISNATTSILFVKKKSDDLRLCVDYRELNAITTKNRYSLSLINEAMNRVVSVKYFIKLNIQNAYHLIRIKKDDKWKTAFRTHYD
jgi:hypothetical protein